jgi:signal transduction histidine kinase
MERATEKMELGAIPDLTWERQTMEVLSSLSYRSGELNHYLHDIACGVSKLIGIDWSVVTLCKGDVETVLASSVDMGNAPKVYSLHGELTGTVFKTGCCLIVEDARAHPEYGNAPEGYKSYLGIPLRTAQGEVIGTICSFHKQMRMFTSEEVKVVELFAERAATAIDNYYLYQQQLKFNEFLEAEVEKRTEELRSAQTKLVEQERLAAIGEFAATIVHEIRNPLTTLMMGLNYFKKLHTSGAAAERLALALDESGRLQRLLNEILLYAKPQVLQLIELDLNEFIAQILPLMQEMPEASDRQIQFIPLSSPVKILGDPDKLKQVLINIIRNACEAVSAGDLVRCSLLVNGDRVSININNPGEPIPPEILGKLTEPFYSTKSTGTGLGLAIVKRIVNTHDGEFHITSNLEMGTTVSVKLRLCYRL